MRVLRVALAILILASMWPPAGPAVRAASGPAEENKAENISPISPIWPYNIQRWSNHIGALAKVYGLDPDFIAAVIRAESNGIEDVVSYQGAVGLMGIMPTGPGFEWRPAAEELENPGLNLRWGASILSHVVQQSGGDLFSALAAYNGGWDQVNSGEPQRFAANVLHEYARAVAARNGIPPDIAPRWAIAIKIERGHIPAEPLIILGGGTPVSGLQTYGEHLVYRYATPTGSYYHVKGYAVPLALSVPVEIEDPFGPPDGLEPELMRLLDPAGAKVSNSNPQVLLACLPTLTRLRGRINTRWFAPSSCPSWHR